MYSRSAFAEALLHGSSEPGIVVRKRNVLTYCAASYIEDKLVLLDMCRARICRMGILAEHIQKSIKCGRSAEHERLLDGEMDRNISLKLGYQLAEAIGLRMVASGSRTPTFF